MRVSRRKNDDSPSTNSSTNTSNSPSIQQNSVGSPIDMKIPMGLKSPLNFQSDTFGPEPSSQAPLQQPVPFPLPSSQKSSSTRVWRLKKYKNSEPNSNQSMSLQLQQHSFSQSPTKNDPDYEELAKPSKKGTRRLPPRRPKTDKNGNPLEFVFVDASPQQDNINTTSSPQQDLSLAASSPLVHKKSGKFPKNIFRLSSGSKKLVDQKESAMSKQPKSTPEEALQQHQGPLALTLKLSGSLQDLTRARNPSITSIGRSPLKRSYTSLAQQSRLPESTKPRSDSSLSMIYIKIDDNGRAAVLQQPLLSKTLSSSSSVSDISSRHMLLNSSRSRSPPTGDHSNVSPILQGGSMPAPVSASTTPYSLSATDDDDDGVSEDYSASHDMSYAEPENDALVAFTKVMGTKRKQLSRKSSTVSINSNFNNMTLTNGTPLLSPVVVGRSMHHRSISSLSTSRRHSPVRSNSRTLKHSHSVSLANIAAPQLGNPMLDASMYYQSGINNTSNSIKSQPQQFIRQSIQQNIYYPLNSSTNLYNLTNNSGDCSRHNSNDSSSYDHSTTASLGPALDLSSSFTTGSVSSITTPTSPGYPKNDQQLHGEKIHHQPQHHLQQQNRSIHANDIHDHDRKQFAAMFGSKLTPADMTKLNSSDSARTLIPTEQSLHNDISFLENSTLGQSQDLPDTDFLATSFNENVFFDQGLKYDDGFDLFDFISYENNNSNGGYI